MIKNNITVLNFRYETDVKNLDPKYRKDLVITGVSGVGLSGAGISGVGVSGAVPGAALSSGLGAARAMDSGMVRADHSGATGCNNCTLL